LTTLEDLILANGKFDTQKSHGPGLCV
jgi:hypothetical protein